MQRKRYDITEIEPDRNAIVENALEIYFIKNKVLSRVAFGLLVFCTIEIVLALNNLAMGLVWVTFMFLLFVWNTLDWCIYSYKRYILIDSDGITVKKNKFKWGEIDKIEFIPARNWMHLNLVKLTVQARSIYVIFPKGLLSYSIETVADYARRYK